MRARDCLHSFDARVIVQENAATAINLQVYKPGRQDRAFRKPSLLEIVRDTPSIHYVVNAATMNQERSIDAPVAPVENAIGENRFSSVMERRSHSTDGCLCTHTVNPEPSAMAQNQPCLTNAEDRRQDWRVPDRKSAVQWARPALPSFYIGVDGGGSGCRARLADGCGRTLGEGTGPPASLRFGVQRSLAAVKSACAAALANSGLPAEILRETDAVVGLAGLGRKNLFETLAAQNHPFRSVRYENDATIACIGAHAGRSGGVVIVGTGSVALARLQDGEIRIGGYGFPISDEGSGAALGLAAIRLTLRAFDGRAQPSILTDELFQHFHKDAFEIVAWSDEASATDYAMFAPLVMRLAEADDINARAIVLNAAASIDRLVSRIAQAGARRICLLGGLAQKMIAFLRPEVRALLSPPLGDALDGALRLARHAAEEKSQLSEFSDGH